MAFMQMSMDKFEVKCAKVVAKRPFYISSTVCAWMDVAGLRGSLCISPDQRSSAMAKRSATVNFMRNFRALSKDVAFHPCASAQGRDSKEDEGVRGEKEEGKPSPGHGRYAAFFRPTLAFCFADSGSGIGMKPGSLAILFSSDSSLRMVGTIAHLCGWPSARFLR